MLDIVIALIRALASVLGNRKDLALENLALRQQPKAWLPFVDAYRTLCFDPPTEVRETFEALRSLRTAG